MQKMSSFLRTQFFIFKENEELSSRPAAASGNN